MKIYVWILLANYFNFSDALFYLLKRRIEDRTFFMIK
jgi:hypothetical protein